MNGYLCLGEVLVLTGMSETTLRRRIADGCFPAASHRNGHRKYWRREAILAALDGQIRPIA